MAESEEPIIQECATCGALIDVSEEEPFALMHCSTCGAALRVRRQFDHYELQEVLGSGGMGAVYRALDIHLNRSVALKLLRRDHSEDPEIIAQFSKEAAITASINHPHVVKVYTTGKDHGLVYIAMELVDKGSLDDLMNLQKRVPEAQVLEVGVQIAQGLRAALECGLIHRDVKPGNILFADAHTAKIVDFGLAVLMEQAGTVGGEVWGTPYYVAPEKLEEQPEDLRSDIYSLGATLFHAVAGRPPFEAETASMVALKHLKSQPVSLQAFAPDVSSATAYVINKTLHKDPEQRYQTYDKLIEHLQYARTELLEAAAKPREKKRVVLEGDAEEKAMGWLTFAMVAVIVLGGVLLFNFRERVFPRGPGVDTTVEDARKTPEEVAQKDEEARALLAAGQAAEAAEAFRQLEQQPGVPQPLLSWVGFHHGLAEYLAGRAEPARAQFARLAERGVFSHEVSAQKLADFFVNAARLAASQEVSPATLAKDFDPASHEAIALLLLGAKAWALGDFENAGPLFRQYQSSMPVEDGWIDDYKPLAATYLDDFTLYRGVSETVQVADTAEKKKIALQAVREGRARLKRAGSLRTKFAQLEAGLQEEIAAFEEEQTRRLAAQDAAELQALAELRSKANGLCLQYKFTDARQVLAGARVSGDKARRERDTLLKKTDWLARFKSTLINDITVLGYLAPLVKKGGGQVPGGARKANDVQIEVVTPYGTTVVPWAELAPECVWNMGRSFVRPGMAPALAADRQWCLGVFAFLAGKAQDGRALLVEASQQKAEYRDQLNLFPEAAETP